MIELSEAQGAADLWRMGVAGDTLNTAWYARALLPVDWQVSYLTRVGQDRFSDRIVAFLSANGIDTGHVGRDPVRGPGLYAISLDQGERSFTYWRDRSAARLLADDAEALAAATGAADVIYVSGITLAILAPDRRAVLRDALAAARARGALTVFDPNLRPRLWDDAATMRAAIMDVVAASALVLPSYDDEAQHFGDADLAACAARYVSAGAGGVVVKNGGGPVHLAGTEGQGTIHDLPRAVPVDTTGAGDSFNGGYLAARLTGASPDQAVRRAHALATRVIGHPGALIPMAALATA